MTNKTCITPVYKKIKREKRNPSQKTANGSRAMLTYRLKVENVRSREQEKNQQHVNANI